MCGRYGFSVKNAKEVYKRFQIENEVPNLKSHYNIAPGTIQPTITRHSPNSIQFMFWGLIPHWAQDINPDSKPINLMDYANYAFRNGTMQEKREITNVLNRQLYIHNETVTSLPLI